LNFLDINYLEMMIIIDEAHHSAANTCTATVNYFKEAKDAYYSSLPEKSVAV